MYPGELPRGEVLGIGLFCVSGEVGPLSSPAIEAFSPWFAYEDDIYGAAGLVRTDIEPGKYSVTTSCGEEKLTASFTVTGGPAVDRKLPTEPDEVRRKVVLAPQGKHETGGGAVATR
ncbi:hypothetical protein [Amycolatopsis aidingensis]|uniref:hypothetical protein n=1 Tax=Amycolatopsis aidingensis TaxID=2842453 RepID=UPI001C0CDFA9|nr:hypothetical protein [Amycolatopsis aidingensis]